jgi:glutamate/aspartate transport system substrate-binding protein
MMTTASPLLSRITCLAVLAVVGVTPALAERLERVIDTQTIRLGFRESSVPFSFLGSQKSPQGYSIDLCKRIVARVERSIGKKVQTVMVPVTSASRIDALVSGAVDIECGSTTNNAARRQRIQFSIPTYVTGARLLVRSDEAATDFEGLRTRRVAITKGSTSADMVRDLDKRLVLRLQLVEVEDHAAAVELVKSRSADAFVMDEILLLGLTASRPDRDAFKIVGRYISVEPLALGLPKNSPRLKALVDQEVAELMRSGAIAEVYSRWFEQPLPDLPAGLKAPPNRMTREVWRNPSDFVPF